MGVMQDFWTMRWKIMRRFEVRESTSWIMKSDRAGCDYGMLVSNTSSQRKTAFHHDVAHFARRSNERRQYLCAINRVGGKWAWGCQRAGVVKGHLLAIYDRKTRHQVLESKMLTMTTAGELVYLPSFGVKIAGFHVLCSASMSMI
jgi:hypothetical protein